MLTRFFCHSIIVLQRLQIVLPNMPDQNHLFPETNINNNNSGFVPRSDQGIITNENIAGTFNLKRDNNRINQNDSNNNSQFKPKLGSLENLKNQNLEKLNSNISVQTRITQQIQHRAYL